jgi:hypothetical protein
VVEHLLHTQGVAGSSPAPRTIFLAKYSWCLRRMADDVLPKSGCENLADKKK